MAKKPREWSPRGEKYEERSEEDWGNEVTCLIRGRIRVTFLWAGEGEDGDYQGPPDIPVLRFDVFDLRDGENPEEASYSYATAMPAWLPEAVIKSVCERMAADVEKEDSWKRRIEEWTWTNEKEAWKIYQKAKEKGKQK